MSSASARRSVLLGLTLALLSAICFGSAGPVTKALSMSELNSVQITQGRMTFAAIVLLIIVLFKSRKQLIVDRSEWGVMLTFGILAFCMNQTLYTIAVTRIPVGVALLLEYLAPVLIALWIILVRKTHLSSYTWVGVGSVLIGLYFIGEVNQGFHLDIIGVLAGIGTAISLAARFILADRGLSSRNPAALAAIGATIGAAALNLFSSPINYPWQVVLNQAVIIGGIETSIWLLFCWLAIVSTVIAYLAGVSAQKYLAPTTMSQLATMEVIFATLFTAILLDEHLTTLQLFGGTIMLMGVTIAQFLVAKNKVNKAREIANKKLELCNSKEL